MKSKYAEYIKERLGKEIYEDARGFATYYFVPHMNACYLEDIYVEPVNRRKGVASLYADVVTEIAKEHGCTKLIGSVVPKTSGATGSLKALLSYGFMLDSCDNNVIYLVKEI